MDVPPLLSGPFQRALPPRPRSCRSPRRFGVLGSLALIAACAHTAGPGRPDPSPPAWIDADLATTRADPRRLGTDSLGQGDAATRLARLDRLLDLYDAARFTQDPTTLESLWIVLGGHTTQRGPEASREAALRILEAALALEEEAAALGDQGRAFLADLIMLVSADLELPETAEQLQVQTLAYRTVADQGHPRIADNAHWRLYDHVRGCLAGALEAPPELRLEIVSHALYVRQDDITPQLEDTAPHGRPPPPTAATLTGLLDAHRNAVAEHSRWHGVAKGREAHDRDLAADLAVALPAPRALPVALARVERGTGRAESFAPVVVADADQMTVDWGHPTAQGLEAGAGAQPLATRLQAVNARDGRGAVLVAADPLLPAPKLATLLDAARRARLERLELAVREPPLAPRTEPVVTALPLELGSEEDTGAQGRAVRDARIRVHLDGRGPRLGFDGRWLPKPEPGTAALARRLEALDRAYPRERVAVLTVGGDVQYRQLLDLVVALIGGQHPHYDAVVLVPGPGPDGSDAQAAELLEVRASLYVEGSVALEQAFPLHETDQRRLESLADTLRRCTPELEAIPRHGRTARVDLVFDDGRLAEIEVWRLGRRLAGAQAALQRCVDEETRGFRLREHRDRIKVTVALPLPAANR